MKASRASLSHGVAVSRILPAAWCVATLLIFALPALAEQRPVLTRHVRDVVVNRQVPLVGLLPPTQNLKLAITLPLRNQTALNHLLEELYDPQSPSYRQYLSVQEFTDRFGPAPEDYEAAIHFAEAHGMTVTHTAANRFLIDVTASVASIESTFHVLMGVYKHPTEDRTFYAPDREPTVNLSVQLWHISGLDNFSLPQPMLRYRKGGETVRSEQTGSGPDGQFLGSDMRTAYYGGTALTGAGQSIGLFELQTYNVSDVQLYFSSVSQPLNVPIDNVLVDGVVENCGADCSGDGETANDIVQAISMAPGAAAVIVYGGTDDVDIFNQMATDNIAKQMSVSYGWLPADTSSDDPIFEEFATQGQSLFVASGDNGAYDATNNPTYYPEDDVYVTVAGGTQLTTNGPGGPWESEIGWGGANMQCGGNGTGSGGGISTDAIPIPSYQQLAGVINSSNQGSTTLRNVPDVASDADCNNYWVSGGSTMEGLGGTSLSAPKWAGFLALVNEQAANNGKPYAGFLNPLIYAIGTGPNHATDFHDITSGTNPNSAGESYSAAVGYDLVTGWGSPNGQNLINALAGGSGSCTPTAITPFIQSNGGSWSQTNTATVASGSTVNLGPQPLTGGTWSWTGPSGFTSTAREIDSIPLSTGTNTFVATYTNPSGCKSTETFTITVTGTGTPIVPFIQVNGGSWSQTNTATVASGSTVNLGPQPLTGGTWSWTGPSGFSSTAREIDGIPLSTGTNTFVATYTNSSGVKSTETFTITVTGSSPTSVSLTSSFNREGIVADGTTFSATGGLDDDGSAYSSNLLGTTLSFGGETYNFGAANGNNAVSGSGQTITLPAASFSTLRILATAVNGNQASQTFTVTYTNGTTTTITQSLSDWFTPQSFSGESVAKSMAYRDTSGGTKDDGTFDLYGYSFAINKTLTVKSIKLPSNSNVEVLAISLVP